MMIIVLSTPSELCSKTRPFFQHHTGVPTANETALHFRHCANIIRDFFDTPIKQFVRHPQGFNISLVTSNTGLDTAMLIRSLRCYTY